MIRLITDTSTLYSPQEALELGFHVNPLTVTIASKTFREFVDIDDVTFLEYINQGNLPTSSQPAIGDVVESLQACGSDDVIVLCMADGLSGTYQSACMAKKQLNDPDNIHIINTQTLCGPHRYIVQEALKMIKNNDSLEVILKRVHELIATANSFLMPQDFGYLKRGGRTTPLAATLGGFLKLKPVLIATEDGKRLDKFKTARTFDIAIASMIEYYQHKKLDNSYRLYICHAFAKEQAEYIKEAFLKAFGHLHVEIFPLSCAFITQGGPQCISIQTIKA